MKPCNEVNQAVHCVTISCNQILDDVINEYETISSSSSEESIGDDEALIVQCSGPDEGTHRFETH